MLKVACLLRPRVIGGGPHAEGEGDGREVHDSAVVLGQNFVADVQVEEEEGGDLHSVVGDTEECDEVVGVGDLGREGGREGGKGGKGGRGEQDGKALEVELNALMEEQKWKK